MIPINVIAAQTPKAIIEINGKTITKGGGITANQHAFTQHEHITLNQKLALTEKYAVLR